MNWTQELTNTSVENFGTFSLDEQQKIINYLNENISPEEVKKQLAQKHNALENIKKWRGILEENTQLYPECMDSASFSSVTPSFDSYAIVLTAGWEGERLIQSLKKEWYSDDELKDFTKATFPLPDFPGNVGALQINCIVIRELSKKFKKDIPVIITTGPKNSSTARIIPEILKKNDNFWLRNLHIIAQNERIHFSTNDMLAFSFDANNNPELATNPDETGGPIMKLKEYDEFLQKSPLEWLWERGVRKLMILQGTAVYDPKIILSMASAWQEFDGVGIGVARSSFPHEDPYGTYVLIQNQDQEKKLIIVEKDIRTKQTYLVQNKETRSYLPFNTGFYIFDCTLLSENNLPDYATPAKEVLLWLPPAPKIWYAATDIIALAKKPAVLTINPSTFWVIKNSSDLPILSKLAKDFWLDAFVS